MKHYLYIAVLSLLSLHVSANPVSQQKAMQEAQSFFASKGLKATLRLVKKQPLGTQKEAQASSYYVFNAGSGGGYVIISGDDATAPVLGYTSTGTFSKDHLPEQLKEMLQQYDAQIRYIAQHNITPQTYKAPTQAVRPLIKTTWGQSFPYNNLCPSDVNGRCLSGCVATAMAQIMYYHKWPQTQTSTISSYSSNGITVDELPATTFDWANMLTNYNGYNSTSRQETAVAKLMAYCGASVHMAYSSQGSGSQGSYVPRALINNFGYARTARTILPDNYSLRQLDSLMVGELQHHRPVLLTGISNIGGGHAFVCSGYDGNGLYHINWGWNGYCDGYYRLSLLDPLGQGIAFNLFREAIVGIQPQSDDTAETEAPFQEGRLITEMDSHVRRSDYTQPFNLTTPDGYSFMIMPSIFTRTCTPTVALAEVENGQVKQVYGSTVNDLSEASLSAVTFAGFSLGANEHKGHKKLVAVWRENDADNWHLSRNSDYYYLDLNYDDTLLTVKSYPVPDFQVQDVRLQDNIDGKNGQRLSLTLNNRGGDFQGMAYLLKVSEQPQIIGYANVSIAAATTDSLLFEITPDNRLGQTDYYMVVYDLNNEGLIYTNMLTRNTDIQPVIRVLNADEKGKIIGNTVDLSVTYHNKGTAPYRGFITITLCKDNDALPNATRITRTEIANGDSMTLHLTLPCNVYNSDLNVTTSWLDETMNDKEISSPVFRLVKGIVLWNKQGDESKTEYADKNFVVPDTVSAVNFRYSNITAATPNASPNTIYLMSKSTKGITANMVGPQHTSANITLQDGYAYYVPEKVYCVKAAYTRKVDAYCWSTLVMPFAPTTITDKATGEVLSLRKSATDNGKVMLLKPVSVSASGVNCEIASQIEPFKPYLIAVDESLHGHELTFTMQKDTLPVTTTIDDGTWLAYNSQRTISNAYTFDGTHFKLATTLTAEPFRAYLKAANYAETLAVVSPFALADGISELTKPYEQANNAYYTLQGIRVEHPTKGIYIRNGRKVVVR